jgi:hypothetical protein
MAAANAHPHPERQEYVVVVEDPASNKDVLPTLVPNGTPLSSSPGGGGGFSPINGREGSASRRRSGRSSGDSLDKLRALPEMRPMPWYKGKELSAERSTQSSRVQTRGACLLARRGNIMDPPCNHCLGGSGRFSLCISLPDFFNGACATCQLATRGNLCTYRKKDTIRMCFPPCPIL